MGKAYVYWFGAVRAFLVLVRHGSSIFMPKPSYNTKFKDLFGIIHALNRKRSGHGDKLYFSYKMMFARTLIKSFYCKFLLT